MPHIHLETTADLVENTSIPEILEALASRLSEYETVSSKSVKAYHTLRSVWAVGEGHPAGFAHVTVQVLSGRPEELRKSMADGLFATMREQFSDSLKAGEAGLTLEIREMDAATYRK